MSVRKVYDDGQIFNADVLDITPATIAEGFQRAISNLASISIASGYITKPATPHIIANAFKNLASVTFVADYSFKQAEALKEAAKNAVVAGPSGGSGAPAGGKPAAAKEEEKEKEEDVDMGGLFGDDYWFSSENY